ncbi:hypothetical protein PWT90_01363 [Aphanocladium album]|nr:hypothetical protein PWT90_01363 [Aphanocladium album]
MSSMSPDDPSAGSQLVSAGKQKAASYSAASTTNLGPMPSMDLSRDCKVAVYDGSYEQYANGMDQTMRILRDPRSCLPSVYWTAAVLNQRPVYSPASACPADYAPACTEVASGAVVPAAESAQLWPHLATGEIAIGCCPRYEVLPLILFGGVYGAVDALLFKARLICAIASHSGFACATLSSGYGCSSTLKVGETTVAAISRRGAVEFPYEFKAASSVTVIASAIRVVYITNQSASTASSTPTSTPTLAPTPSKPADGTSTVQKIALGFCAPFFAIAIMAALVAFCRRRRKIAKEGGVESAKAERMAPPATDAYGMHELDGAQSRDSRVNDQEGSSLPAPVEMPGSEYETLTQHEIVELPADERSACPSRTSRLSPVIRRKPVTASPYLVGDEPFGTLAAESRFQP